MSQLDLLAWKRPAEILAFPLNRRVGRIRSVAAVLLKKKGTAADTYWRGLVRSLVTQMQRSGLSERVIVDEINAFHDAVHAELNRPARGDRGGGDAA